jgi:hypothetical protein
MRFPLSSLCGDLVVGTASGIRVTDEFWPSYVYRDEKSLAASQQATHRPQRQHPSHYHIWASSGITRQNDALLYRNLVAFLSSLKQRTAKIKDSPVRGD